MMVMIEPTTRCNLNCSYCSYSRSNRPKKDLALYGFCDIIGQIPNIDRIHLQGLGEPFLCKDLGKMADCCDCSNITVTTTTNGTIVDSSIFKFDRVVISYHGKDLTRILDYINKYHEVSETTFALTCVVTWDNADHIKTVNEYGKEYGIPISLTRGENWIAPLEGEAFVNSKGLIVPGSRDRGPHNCRWGIDQVFISVEGYVTPCCIRMNPMVYNFGNVFQTPFNDIWTSPMMNYWRGHRAITCRGCPD